MQDPLFDDTAQAFAGTPFPCAAGLLAGTLALMTGWAEPEPTACLDTTRQRALMARKIVANLFLLREHPDVPPGLRRVATKLHARWSERVARTPSVPRADAAAARRALGLH